MKYKIAVIEGDGIGKEVIPQAIRVLKELDIDLSLVYAEAGYEVFKRRGVTVPEETIDILKHTDACLSGPMMTPPGIKGYRSASVTIRKIMDLYANIRPIKNYPGIRGLKDNVDLVIVRENTEGLYSGIEWRIGNQAYTLRVITHEKSYKVSEYAFKIALERRKKVTFVTKANIMRETCGLFRETVFEVSKKYKDVLVEEVFIDAMSMKLIQQPSEYDVVLCPNLFGDILSDEASVLVGSIGILPSANIGDTYAMFQPVHGTAPDIAGKNIANPTAAILSAKMLLEYLGEKDKATLIEKALITVFKHKIFTRDLQGNYHTDKFTDKIIENLRKIL